MTVVDILTPTDVTLIVFMLVLWAVIGWDRQRLRDVERRLDALEGKPQPEERK
jgi:hypothetical protein